MMADGGLRIANYGMKLSERMASESAIHNPQSAIISLGSNLGDSPAILRQAMARLQEFSDLPLRKSSLWQTTPVDCPPDSPMFINAVAVLVPPARETPESLLTKLQSLEKEFGRNPRTIRNEPRPLDLDLIAFGSQTRHTATLTLPHPRASRRRFVLQPLCEIAPDYVLPGQSRTAAELLELLPKDEMIRRLG
jgi:2-amino-4-hydroxy-6-hydroxymethyldihydropteridine diphosphokinase